MTAKAGWHARELRRELGARNRLWARDRAHVESYGDPPVIVYAPEEDGRHGNFFDEAYRAIAARPEWMRRFDKIHSQGRAIPKAESGRRWRELDSSMSSDALLMNVFCAPGAPGVRQALSIQEGAELVFGWKARVALANGRFDRTEVDMRWGGLLVEAKLTEGDFQTRAARIVEGYRDFDAVFERERLPRVVLREARRRTAIEFAEEFTQEWEEVAPDNEAARAFQQEIVERAREAEPAEPGYAGYQLIRNVLAASVARHIEDRIDAISRGDAVSVGIGSPHLRETLPFGRLRCPVPCIQRYAQAGCVSYRLPVTFSG